MSTETSPSIRIADHDLAASVMVIAEIGNNHEGDVALAREMIAAAAAAGVDAVKFQTIEPALLVSHDQQARITQLERFQLTREDFESLAEAARKAGVAFLSTPFHLDAVSWLDPLVPAFKIASGDCTYTRLLETVADTDKPILLSTGAATLDEVRAAQATVAARRARRDREPGLVLMHCVLSYPTEEADANLSAIADLAGLGAPVGYSDHTMGVDAAVLSVALGARVIEKHFTLDKAFSEFRDHALSADPDDMAKLVRRVRRAETLIGGGGKRVQDCEAAARDSVRRSVHARRDIAAGTVISLEDVACVRPASGLPPAQETAVVGRTLRRSLVAGMPLREEDLA